MIGYKIKLYNLPQRVKGGVKIHGAYRDGKGKDIPVLFHHLEGMTANCTIEGTNTVINLPADTPLVELNDGEYQFDKEALNG